MARPDRSAERREEILDAAVTLIERHDIATLRLADLASHMGLTTNAVRYYFKDISQVLSELAQRSDDRFKGEGRKYYAGQKGAKSHDGGSP